VPLGLGALLTGADQLFSRGLLSVD